MPARRAPQYRLPFSHGRLLAGVDEVGRGPLAGPVVAAAVVLHPRHKISGLRDSKLLSPSRREKLADTLRCRALAWAIAWADEDEIDALNILRASLLAMRRALEGLVICPEYAQVDGRHCPAMHTSRLRCVVDPVIGGDGKIAAISAASILAKVHRDAEMRRLDGLYPEYGFVRHKGYATPEHLSALQRHGPCRIHRRSFLPVRRARFFCAPAAAQI